MGPKEYSMMIPVVIFLSRAPAPAFGNPYGSRPAPDVRVQPIPGQAELGCIEVHGVAAGPFDAALWQAGRLHFQPDVRSPLIRPGVVGVFRNIYAPSAVAIPGGWCLFYGGWDGVPTGNDRIYSVFTPDFLEFRDRRIEIEHGRFIHVCNVNAVRLEDGAFSMVCTAYPDANGLNKPAFFTSPDGKAWNGSPAPYPARLGDIVEVDGYPPYPEADINGINVLLREQDRYRLYFGNWKAPGQVHRASSTDGRRYRYDSPCLDSSHAVNDVKKFVLGGRTCYLMGLHANSDRLWYALSADGMRFEPERPLAASLGRDDKFIVAIGWVTQQDRLLGFLYGAGAVPELNRNRIFARWLQKRVVFVADDGRRFEPTGALGPDRQIIALGTEGVLHGRLELFGEDGKTPLCEPIPMRITPGGVYRVVTAGPSG
jgi:hypothetical protein